MNHDIDRTQVGFAHGGGNYPPYAGSPVLNEEEQTHLASRLMDVNSEQELDNFLGDVISGAANAVGKFISSPTGQALGSGLKTVAKQLLPVAGQAVGERFGGSAGGQIGGALGSAAAGLFEVGPEEREWEAANTMVQLASEATKKAAEMPQGGDPHAIARHAIIEAAKIHAPHLVPYLTGESGQHHHQCGCRHGEHEHERGRQSGRWYRHRGRVILIGI